MYEFIREKMEGKRLTRVYKNINTFTEVKTSLLLTDKEGRKWWGFSDLRQIPYIRIAYAKHISDLYTVGLSLKDIQLWCNQEKALLKSEDPEKHEKLYALVLEKERLATFTADPIKMHLALCSVYVLGDEERIDFWDEKFSEEKVILWSAFPELISFFLNWHTDHMRRFTKTLSRLTAIVSNLQESRGISQQPKD